jgi:recombination protein RecA
MTETKQLTVDQVIAKLQKAYGDTSLRKLTGALVPDVEVISTGAASIDRATGIGGLPRGRIVEIYGPEASGKTTIALHTIAEAQANGLVAAFIDAEHALDLKYAQAIGVQTDGLIFSQPDSGEHALNIVEDLVDTGEVQVIVVDSVAALTPQAEIDGEMGVFPMGGQSRLMGQAMRKLAAKVAKTNALLIFINQMRMKIGVMYGSPETTTGGNALKFYASIRLDVRRREQLKKGDAAYGNKTSIKVVKNKLAPPFQEAEVEILWGTGIDKVSDLVGTALHKGIIEKAGAWYSYAGKRLGQGFDNVIKTLREDSDALAEIIGKVRAAK